MSNCTAIASAAQRQRDENPILVSDKLGLALSLNDKLRFEIGQIQAREEKLVKRIEKLERAQRISLRCNLEIFVKLNRYRQTGGVCDIFSGILDEQIDKLGELLEKLRLY